jgi:hypothetical protein
LELTAGETQLIDEGMGHRLMLLLLPIATTRQGDASSSARRVSNDQVGQPQPRKS